MSAGVIFAGTNEYQQKLDQLNSQINNLEKQLKEGKTEEKNINAQISNYDNLIAVTYTHQQAY